MVYKSLLSLFGCFLYCLPTAAVAQDFSVPVMITPWDMGTTSTTNIENLISQQLNEDLINQRRSDSSPEGASSSAARDADFTYLPNSTRTQKNLRNFIARTPVEAGRADLEQMFAAQPRLMDDIRAAIQPYGLDSHNTADAYALWLINAWLIANKRDEDPDLKTVAAVKWQVRNAFAATPDMAKTSDAERQEYAEALLIQAVMLEAAFEQLKNDPKLLDQLADAARKGAEASGLDLSRMSLTSSGFVPRKGADASGSVGGEDDTIRNARVDTPAAESESSSLGLALAAGAGLGVTLLGGLALMRRG